MATRDRSTRQTNRLKALRQADGLSQQDLAALIPAPTTRGGETIRYRTIERWESGESSIPEKYWGELAFIFRVSVTHLLGLDERPDPLTPTTEPDDEGDGVEVAA